MYTITLNLTTLQGAVITRTHTYTSFAKFNNVRATLNREIASCLMGTSNFMIVGLLIDNTYSTYPAEFLRNCIITITTSEDS